MKASDCGTVIVVVVSEVFVFWNSCQEAYLPGSLGHRLCKASEVSRANEEQCTKLLQWVNCRGLDKHNKRKGFNLPDGMGKRSHSSMTSPLPLSTFLPSNPRIHFVKPRIRAPRFRHRVPTQSRDSRRRCRAGGRPAVESFTPLACMPGFSHRVGSGHKALLIDDS